MNKRELSLKMAEKLDMKKFMVYQYVEVLMQTIVESLESGDKVVLSSFGTLEVVKRHNKSVRNPNDGKMMVIPSIKTVKFKASKKLIEKMEEGK